MAVKVEVRTTISKRLVYALQRLFRERFSAQHLGESKRKILEDSYTVL